MGETAMSGMGENDVGGSVAQAGFLFIFSTGFCFFKPISPFVFLND
jgi:hypothetical protein